jgi:hypothetical protein
MPSPEKRLFIPGGAAPNMTIFDENAQWASLIINDEHLSKRMRC